MRTSGSLARPGKGLLRPKLAALLAAPAALIAAAALSTAPAQAAIHPHATVHVPVLASPTQVAGPNGPQAAPAYASRPNAYGAIICGGDTCAQSHNTGASSQPIYTWAWTYTFTGHWQLYECSEFGGCLTYGNSNNTTWIAGGKGYCCFGPPDGWTANITAWAGPYSSGAKWRSLGTVSFGVGGIY